MNKFIASLVVASFLFTGTALFHAGTASAKTHKPKHTSGKTMKATPAPAAPTK